MKRSSYAVLPLVALLLVGAGCANTTTTDSENANSDTAAAVTNTAEVQEAVDAMLKDDEVMEKAMEEVADEDEASADPATSEVVDLDAMEKANEDEVADDADTTVSVSADEVDDTTEEVEVSEPTVGTYRDYDASAVATAAADGTAVLFFHASWCPTCAALNRNIESEADDIPADLTIFKVDYDTETDLRKKYGVTYQHTLVQVDADGEQITKWSGGNTLDSIVSKVQ